ncbi:MAG: uracil phosphoribosyltransferase [Clostridia bacterium]|nr:uracil phosphoribosyltransferase [Clostridia bacterium]
MSNVHVFDHPLIQHKLSVLRNKDTCVKEFRELVSEIAMLMCFEATRDLPLEEIEIETPVAMASCRQISGKKLAIVPILRAGLGMVDGMVAMMPNAKVGHIGLYRDPTTLEPVKYYFKMPPDIFERDVIIVDPMLATGGSASAATKFLKEVGVKHIKLMSIIGAPEGVARMQEDHPDVDIFVAALDDHLNEHGYIVPGLGDAGDRIFGTK